MRGILYIARNDRHEENVYKIGKTENFNIERRMNQLTNETSNLGKYYSKAHFIVDDLDFCESSIHKKLDRFRIQDNREFFKCSINKIIIEIKDLLDDKIKETFYDGWINKNWIMDFVDEVRETNLISYQSQGSHEYVDFLKALKMNVFNAIIFDDNEHELLDKEVCHNYGFAHLPDSIKEKVIYEVIEKLSELEAKDFERKQYEGLKISIWRSDIYSYIINEVKDALIHSKLNYNEKRKLKNRLSIVQGKLPYGPTQHFSFHNVNEDDKYNFDDEH